MVLAYCSARAWHVGERRLKIINRQSESRFLDVVQDGAQEDRDISLVYYEINELSLVVLTQPQLVFGPFLPRSGQRP